jgi:hypothetical protein
MKKLQLFLSVKNPNAHASNTAAYVVCLHIFLLLVAKPFSNLQPFMI